MTVNQARKAVFLDRDGTINVEKDYLYRIEDFEFIEGAVDAIRALKESGFLVIVVTNQSGVARGFYTLDDVATLHGHIQDELGRAGTRIDAFYACPHHPDAGAGTYTRDCDCRKGNPGMLLQAAREHHVDLQTSFMVGDKLADVEAGVRAGCHAILVQTGYADEAAVADRYPGTPVCSDLIAAVRYILDKSAI